MSDNKNDVNGGLQSVKQPAETGEEKPQPLPAVEATDFDTQEESGKTKSKPLWRRIYDIAFWVPPNCRWGDRPPKFSMGLNVLFAFAGAFTVANLYYNHPILNILAHDFNVPYEKVAQIPTVAQAGYAGGLFFLCPLGDLLKRRPFVLALVLFTATMTIGICTTQSLAVFSAIQFITGFTTVTPQLMLPLVGDLAPPNRRATALSIVVSGFVLGILVARLLSGILTNYTSWRNVYWMSVGLQYAIFISLWLFMPDYPSTNKRMNYFKMLWSMLVMLTKHPILVQACLVSFFTSSTFTSFWTVLTFLLAGPPYNFDSVTIGLFALIGIASMFVMPLYARAMIDRFVPWFSVIMGMIWCLLGICFGAYLGTFTVAGPILQAWFLDLGMQSAQIANRSSIYSVEPKGRNRVNTCFMVFTFFGQLTGTSVGAHLYARSGWIGSQSFSVGAIGMALIITFARGPWEKGWVGWHGGFSILKKNKATANGDEVEENRNPLRRLNTNEEAAARAVENGDSDLEKGVVSYDQTPVDLDDDGKESPVENVNDNRDEDEDISSKSEEIVLSEKSKDASA